MHHEGQWNEAFHFHGAQLEAERADSRSIGGILTSLHSVGFDRLAMTTLKSLGSLDQPNHSTISDLRYELGWRTETWDLPDVSNNQIPGAAVYNALRAVHRGRDPLVLEQTLRASFANEMKRLRELGTEDLIEIRRTIQNIMCLAQIKTWKQETLGADIAAKTIDPEDKNWLQFIKTDTDIE